MKLQEQTWSGIAEMDKSKAVVLVPLGAMEQHGLHLPLGVDSFLIQSLAESVEEVLKDQVMLLPTVWVGHSPHHMNFAGTVSVTHNVYAELLVQMISSLVSSGFNKFMLLNGHGGNMMPVQMALQSLKTSFRGDRELFVCGLNYWNLALRDLQEIRDSGIGGMGHACEMETSMMMFLYPQFVDDQKMVKDGHQPELEWIKLDMLHSSPLSVVYDFHEISDTGTFGDPTLASADKGERFIDAALQQLRVLIHDISEV